MANTRQAVRLAVAAFLAMIPWPGKLVAQSPPDTATARAAWSAAALAGLAFRYASGTPHGMVNVERAVSSRTRLRVEAGFAHIDEQRRCTTADGTRAICRTREVRSSFALGLRYRWADRGLEMSLLTQGGMEWAGHQWFHDIGAGVSFPVGGPVTIGAEPRLRIRWGESGVASLVLLVVRIGRF